MDIRKFTEEEKAEVKAQIAEYHKYYDLIRKGDLYRVLSPFDKGEKVAWEFVSEDKSQCLLTVVCVHEHPLENFILKLKGLDENTYYQDEASGKVYSGAQMMHVGLNLSGQVNTLYGSKKWYFTKVKSE